MFSADILSGEEEEEEEVEQQQQQDELQYETTTSWSKNIGLSFHRKCSVTYKTRKPS